MAIENQALKSQIDALRRVAMQKERLSEYAQEQAAQGAQCSSQAVLQQARASAQEALHWEEQTKSANEMVNHLVAENRSLSNKVKEQDLLLASYKEQMGKQSARLEVRLREGLPSKLRSSKL